MMRSPCEIEVGLAVQVQLVADELVDGVGRGAIGRDSVFGEVLLACVLAVERLDVGARSPPATKEVGMTWRCDVGDLESLDDLIRVDLGDSIVVSQTEKSVSWVDDHRFQLTCVARTIFSFPVYSAWIWRGLDWYRRFVSTSVVDLPTSSDSRESGHGLFLYISCLCLKFSPSLV